MSTTHRSARLVDAHWIGRRVTVTAPDGTTWTGALSDVEQYPTVGRTLLYLGGHPVVDVPDTTAVTVDNLGLIGGEPR